MDAVPNMPHETTPTGKSSLDMKQKSFEHNLRQYQARLARFEAQHHMTSDQFAARFNAGELGDNPEWFEWEFMLDARRETARQLTRISERIEMERHMEEPFEITIEKNQTLDTMLHQVLNQALVAIGAEAGSLMLVAKTQGILQIKARLGKPRPGRKTEAVYSISDKSVAGSKSIASWVVQNKQSYLCPDVEKDALFAPSRSGTNFLSLLSVPIIHDDRVLAVINADAEERNYFTEAHQKRLESIASQVATPIAERTSVFKALGEISVELTRLPRHGGVGPVLDKIAELAVRSLGVDVVTLYQYVQEKDEFPVEGTGPTIAGKINDPRPMQRKVYPKDVPWIAVKERRSGFYSNVQEEPFLTGEVNRPGDAPRPRFIEREGIESMAALLLPYRAGDPEHIDEEVVGVMFANYRTHHEFNIDEISALATFADYAAAAILGARQAEKRQRQAEQWHDEQVQMVESFSANFAHRMSNLAGTSRVATQLLRERINQSDSMSLRQLDRIERESEVLLELAERLTRPFKATGKMLERTLIDITQLIKDEIERIKPDATNIKLIPELAENLPKVESVDFQLRQVLHDILNNALEAMKDQAAGRLIIRAQFNRRTNRVEVEISDNGPGIREDMRDRLFTAGVTAKTGKLGIGLWWCRTFMRAAGGDVILKGSGPGEGATFVIEIPCIGTRISSFREQFDILVVEDEPRWRDELIDSLTSDRQYTLRTARNYVEARHALESNRFKLAVLDIRLIDSDEKNEDGLRLLADLEKMDRDTKVIIITAYGTEQQEQIAKRSSRLVAFIHKKDLDVPRFRSLVRQATSYENPSQSS